MRKNILTPAGWIVGVGFMLVSISSSAAAQNLPTNAPAATPAPANKSTTPATPAAKANTPAYKQPMTSWGNPTFPECGRLTTWSPAD
jgi:pyruvate/2-oxoglutarate dehydrogenase complex dihydrolipoamide acyltransferase (E2) component